MGIPPILLIIGSYFAMVGGVWALFNMADKAIKEETRISISHWLLEPRLTGGVSEWSSHFIRIFDGVFGGKHLSWKCFSRSCIASFIAISIISLIYMGIPEFEGEGATVTFLNRPPMILHGNWYLFLIIYFFYILIPCF